jgi:hypothetical protein
MLPDPAAFEKAAVDLTYKSLANSFVSIPQGNQNVGK